MNDFLNEIGNKELYRPSYSIHLNKEYFYYEKCVLLDESLGMLLLSKVIDPHIINEFLPVTFMIVNGVLYLKLTDRFFYGYINNKYIFIPEIIIYFSNEGESKMLSDLLKYTKIDIILQQTKIINKNFPDIGIYNNTNIKIIILNNKKYTIQKEEETNVSTKAVLQKNMREVGYGFRGDIYNDNNNGQNGQYKNIQNIKNDIKATTYNQQRKNSLNNNFNNMQIRKEIENFIYIIIDMKKIIKKMKMSLVQNSQYEKYYIINFEWFLEYMKFFNLYNLFTNQLINQTIENIINNSKNDLTNEDIFSKAKSNQEFSSIINNYYNNIKSSNFATKIRFTPKKIEINDIFYYNNFILINEDTIKLLSNNNYKKEIFFNCYFGDNKIFVVFNGPNKYLIEVYYIEQEKSNVLGEIFFRFNKENDLSIIFSLFKEKGYLQTIQVCLMFNKDFTSPIFDPNNKEIGYAYKYNQNIKDYTPYIINNEYKTMIKLFFHYIKLHSISIKNKTENSYLLIRSEYMKKYKDYYEYLKLEKDLSQDKDVYQLVLNINENYNYIIDDKMMTLIIKKLQKKYNQIFINKSKYAVQANQIGEEPNLKSVQNTELLYYDDFELIDKELYTLLFKKSNSGNFCTCYFINDDICIKMPKVFGKTNSAFYVYGSLHSQQNFKSKYLLEYNRENDFKKSFNFSNQTSGFDKYINSFEFKNTSTEQLIDIDNNPLGIIYKLNIPYNPHIPGPNPPVPISDDIIPIHDDSVPIPVPVPIPDNQPPLIGLKNVGATCYMNATLQCFSQIQDLILNFKNNQQVYNTIAKYKQMNKKCLTESFKILIDNLCPKQYDNHHSKNANNYYYAPYDFKEKISKMNPLFKGVQANDAKDLVNFIIMTLHEELNMGQKQNNVNMNLQAFQTNEQMMLCCFMNIFGNENKSIISNTFYGVTHTYTKCSNCPFFNHNFEAYFFLIFPLEEVRKFKIEEINKNNLLLNQNINIMNANMMMNMNQNIMMNFTQMQKEYQDNLTKLQLLQNNLLNIEDCFDYNQKIENFVGENAMYCDICKMQLPSTFQTKLYNAPEVLILILNRGKGIQFKIKLQFYLQINVSNYIENKNSGCIYDLIGVVTHMGDSSENGHFISSCKNPMNNCWYQYNDDLVFPINDFNKQVLNYAMPYILFYKKCH